jgi:hypothetical protein
MEDHHLTERVISSQRVYQFVEACYLEPTFIFGARDLRDKGGLGYLEITHIATEAL